MSIIGLDFGSHTGSMALWYDEKDVIEVIADDLGSRTIPTSVAYRGDEIITGQSSTNQQFKNPTNTFDDIRTILLNPDIENVYVPQLDKEVSIQEICSHWFRNIHNQIKQQVGKPVRECVISIPKELLGNEILKKRIMESAQAGGIRLKCMIDDATSGLMAYGFDDATQAPSIVIVVDIGWSKTSISLYKVSGGLYFPIGEVTSSEVSGKVFVKLVAEFCVKDFQRKTKQSCQDSNKAMMRLRRECELAIKSLSTGAEATIDIDSLYEGIDYSSKLTRARFEDIISIPFIHLKKSITDVLTNNKLTAEEVTHVCMTGGFTAVPKILSTLKSIFATSTFPKGRFEYSEAQCIGACIQAKNLMKQNLLDNVPTQSPVAPCLTSSIAVTTADSTTATPTILISSNTVLPVVYSTSAEVSSMKSSFKLLAVDSNAVATPLANIAFAIDDASSDKPAVVTLSIDISADGEIIVTVTNAKTNEIAASLTVPKAE